LKRRQREIARYEEQDRHHKYRKNRRENIEEQTSARIDNVPPGHDMAIADAGMKQNDQQDRQGTHIVEEQ